MTTREKKHENLLDKIIQGRKAREQRNRQNKSKYSILKKLGIFAFGF